MKYPLGIQNFEGLRTDGYLYMDKTAMVYDIVKNGKYYFPQTCWAALTTSLRIPCLYYIKAAI